MNDNESRDESVMDGVFDEIAVQNHETFTQQGRPERAATDPAATGATGPQSDHTKKQASKQAAKDEATDDEGGDNADGLDTQDFSRDPKPTADTTTQDEASTDPSQDEPANEDVDAWKKSLPLPPPEFKLEPPKPDEFGQIDPQEYTQYVTEKAKHEIRQETYSQVVVTKAFEEAERILPELKTNATLQSLVRNGYLAQIYAGDPGDPVAIARDLKSVLGQKKIEGAQSAKTSISIQKNAAVESRSATQKKADTSKSDNLERRLKSNDTSAFEELMDGWLAEGKV